MYRPSPSLLPSPPHITPMSLESLGITIAASGVTIAASGALTTNRTYYIPVWPHNTILVKRLFALNGTTASTNTVSLSLYSSAGGLPVTQLATASATSAGASALQFQDITDTILTAGRLYFMAIAINGTTATVFRWANVGGSSATVPYYIFTEASNSPNPATPVAAAGGVIPVIGLDLRGAP